MTTDENKSDILSERSSGSRLNAGQLDLVVETSMRPTCEQLLRLLGRDEQTALYVGVSGVVDLLLCLCGFPSSSSHVCRV